MEMVREWLPLALGIGAAAIFVTGLVLALRTEGGRLALAEGAVRFALGALALAERWLGRMVSAQTEQRAARIGRARAELCERP